ncbi:DUF2845 domain-containing protein [Dokdonella sp.]|uniref:DUF2845 domain-containing protein n=1 Tax=Dokdonella sp. TaxID=2291710 RepID=UPI001B25ED26|nr:DUF2845 domain-containing protein [Dokdonella sp.]MBO9661382.1 DUF2845 domain-containing protein [Dokdonella sp.]
MNTRALLVLFLLFAAPSAFAMRCGSRIVDVGTQDFQVRERCGEPFWTDQYTSVEVIGAYGPQEVQRTVQYDVWYYNFGPRQFMRKFLFSDGALVREETLGYGVEEIGTDCNPMRDYAGFSAGELYARCGEPASRRVQNDTIVRRPAPGVERWRDQRREEWVYDFGDARFLRVVTLVNGRVGGTDTIGR